MRLKTIWTLPYMPFMERLRRTGDWADLAIAMKLPKRIRYWVVMTVIGKITTQGPFSVRHPMSLTVDEVLKAMEKSERTPRS